MSNMKCKRWISLYVQNEIGVLARISSLFSSKSYNLDSLTVGTTEDPTISRMTISVTSDDATFEQIKKQLNRCVEVIKVIDFTTVPIHIKEVLFIKVKNLTKEDKVEEFLRTVEKNKLGMEDTFKFGCKQCGACTIRQDSPSTVSMLICSRKNTLMSWKRCSVSSVMMTTSSI